MMMVATRMRALWLAMAMGMLPAACASSQPEGAQGVEATAVVAQGDADEQIEARLGGHRFRLPRQFFRHQLEPQSGRRFELAMWLPDDQPVTVAPAVGSVELAAKLDIQVRLIDGIPAANLLSFWMRQEPPGPSPDPLAGALPRLRGEAVHGLYPYYVDIDTLIGQAQARSETAASAASVVKFGDADRYLGTADATRPVPTYIECTPRALDDGVSLVGGQLQRSGTGNIDVLAMCDHSFLLDSAEIMVTMHYSRLYLPQWHEIETRVADRLRRAMAAANSSP